MLGVVTLLYSLDYLPGTLTLAYQLRKFMTEGSKDKELCLVLSSELLDEGQLSESAVKVLGELFDTIIEVEPVDLTDPVVKQNQANLMMLNNRSELAFTFMKLHMWELTQYEKILYLDSDVLPLDSDIFRIFDHVTNQTSDQIAAVPDCGWPDLFNSGVMVVKPDKGKYEELHDLAKRELSIDGADQGILNQFFNPMCHDGDKLTEWIRLPFFYNVTSPGAGYQYTPALKFFANKLKLVHFIGKNKPWNYSQHGGRYNDKYRNQWWALYMELCQRYFQSDLDIDIDNLCRHTANLGVSGAASQADYPEDTKPAWDPATEAPPKDLPAEAPNLKIVNSYSWEEELVVVPDEEAEGPALAPDDIEDSLPRSQREPLVEPMVNVGSDGDMETETETELELGSRTESSSSNRASEPKPSAALARPDQYVPPRYEKPKPIFPWESDTEYKATRVFPGDE
ncbi:GT8 Glycogenin [Kluyveromyces marxianus]|nr:GT8 Glycogenin [Kluyveromyces marxianus]